jgi:hypothetical protein
MVGPLHSRVAPDTDEDNVRALVEAGWSDKEIMVVLVLADRAPSTVGRYTACAQRQRSAPV